MTKCRFCQSELDFVFLDLGNQPLANSYISSISSIGKESRYPLRTKLCEECFLVQVDCDVQASSIFSNYAYYSSTSTTWLKHASSYVDDISQSIKLSSDSLVVEVASNDGYLLRHFIEKGIRVMGIEPAQNIASYANQNGIPTRSVFFGSNVAKALLEEGLSANLMVANNVLAHVPDINDFVAGFKILLDRDGIATFEFPHLLNLLTKYQFDTIYHEHYSYLSLLTAIKIFNKHKLKIYDVMELDTHGGSLRIFVCHENSNNKVSDRVYELLNKEISYSLNHRRGFEGFATKVDKIKDDLLNFLRQKKSEGIKVSGYGAAAKGNTLINYCNINSDLLDVVYDKSPYKSFKFLPGSHIEVRPVEEISKNRPDILLVFPWNFRNEIMAEQHQIRGWGGQFVTAIPELSIL